MVNRGVHGGLRGFAAAELAALASPRGAVLVGFVLASTAQVVAVEYVLHDSFLSGNFSSKWHFWTDADPSSGSVQYLGGEAAAKGGLVTKVHGGMRIGADTHSVLHEGGRPSVRMQSRNTYDHGLVLAKIPHMPTGCGTWSALWMYGEDRDHPWPSWGEYDIIEGVDSAQRVMTSLHTTANCTQHEVRANHDFTGTWGLAADKHHAQDNCYIYGKGQWENQGCSQYGPPGSMGAAFNAHGGGTYAALWDPTGGRISTWFWKDGSEPKDVVHRRPDPKGWGKPYSHFSLANETCPSSHFANMQLVFDIDFCGDLGEYDFKQTCAKDLKTSMTCKEFVREHPEKLREAYWLVEYLDVYQVSSDSAQLRSRSHAARREHDHGQAKPAQAPHIRRAPRGSGHILGQAVPSHADLKSSHVSTTVAMTTQAATTTLAATTHPSTAHTSTTHTSTTLAAATAAVASPIVHAASTTTVLSAGNPVRPPSAASEKGTAHADGGAFSLMKVGTGAAIAGLIGVVGIFIFAQWELFRLRGSAGGGRGVAPVPTVSDDERSPARLRDRGSPRPASSGASSPSQSSRSSPTGVGTLTDSRTESRASDTSRSWSASLERLLPGRSGSRNPPSDHRVEAYRRFLGEYPSGRAAV